MRGSRTLVSGFALLLIAAGLVALLAPRGTEAQALPLDDEAMLALVLPPLPGGARPGVHFWARADSARGPGSLPTVFVVTLYTKQASGGAEEHEVVNYLQYSNGAWVLARARDDGTLLVDDWAWISLNLKNLTGHVTGQGDSSQLTIDYTSSGSYRGSQRDLLIEEVYGGDLGLISSGVLADSLGLVPVGAAASSAATRAASTSVATATPGLSSIPPPVVSSPTSTPGLIVPPSNAPASGSPPVSLPTGTAIQAGANSIRPASAPP